MAWLDIKTAIVEMLEDNEYTVANNRKLSRDTDQYLVVVSNDEINTDIGSNYVGVSYYRNTREFQIWVYNKKTTSNVDLDIVKESVKDEMETVLTDIKSIFGTVYNAVGDAGAQSLRYIGMDFVDVEAEGVYAPVRMEITFLVEYLETR